MQLYQFEVLKGEEVISAEPAVPLPIRRLHGPKLRSWRRASSYEVASSACGSSLAERSF